MASARITVVAVRPEPRESKGQRTRERLLGAAIGEFRRAGVASADVKAIAAAAGVAPATFYFHFPTKEHVLIELERREEERIAADLARYFGTGPTLPESLRRIVASLESLEERLGDRLFKDFLALHFSSARLPEDIWVDHPVIVTVVERVRAAHDRGDIPADADPFYSALFFLVGLYALLLTLPADAVTRAAVLDHYVGNALNGMGASSASGGARNG